MKKLFCALTVGLALAVPSASLATAPEVGPTTAKVAVPSAAAQQSRGQEGGGVQPGGNREREDFRRGYRDGFRDGYEDARRREYHNVRYGGENAYERGYRQGYRDGFRQGRAEAPPPPK
jgi:hypothetical protein